MTLTKNKMVREIGRPTRLKNGDVQAMLEALTELWIEELVKGGRIEIENFLVLEVKKIDRGSNSGKIGKKGTIHIAPRLIRRIVAKGSKSLKKRLQDVKYGDTVIAS
jgi:nucleoid DNA-binding protein